MNFFVVFFKYLFSMSFRRGLVLCCKEVELSSSAVKRGGSIGKIVRGAAIGGLAGGAIGLAVEMTPDEWGLKKKVNELGHKAVSVWNLYTYGTVPHDETSRVPRSAEPVRVPVVEPVVDSDKQKTVQEPVVNKLKAVDTLHDPVVDTDEHVVMHEHVVDRNAAEPVVDVDERVTLVEPEVDTQIPVNEPVLDTENRVPTDDHLVAFDANEYVKRTEHESAMATHAGQLEAAMETMNRLYEERERVISIARHALVVYDLMESMALDTGGVSAGSLKVEFARELPALIHDCFSNSAHPTFSKTVLSQLLTALYTNGHTIVHTGPTGTRLHAVERAQEFVNVSDFESAISLLKENKAATNWIKKAEHALLLWQGAEAAIGSVHQDLAQIL